jgi:hypothetical protein
MTNLAKGLSPGEASISQPMVGEHFGDFDVIAAGELLGPGPNSEHVALVSSESISLLANRLWSSTAEWMKASRDRPTVSV